MIQSLHNALRVEMAINGPVEYWAIRRFTRLPPRTAHSFVSAALLAPLGRCAALTHSLARSPVPELIERKFLALKRMRSFLYGSYHSSLRV